MRKRTFRKIHREVALRAKLVPTVSISQEMRDEAAKLALKACEIVEKSPIKDIFTTTLKTREGGYLGQMVFHEWFSKDWRVALENIKKELEQMEKGQKINVVDGEINGATIDVKETDLTLPRTFLAWDPGWPFGLQVPENQFRRKRYDAYVLVILLPTEDAKRYGHDAAIYGYALKEEVARTKPQQYGKHRTLNRSIHWRKLHPMLFFTPQSWNSEMARQSCLGEMLKSSLDFN